MTTSHVFVSVFVVSKVQDEGARIQHGPFSVSAGQEAKAQKGQPTPMALFIHPLLRKELSRPEHLPKALAPTLMCKVPGFPHSNLGNSSQTIVASRD